MDQARGPRYVIQTDVDPQNIRMDEDGNLWGEVPVLLVQGPVGPERRTHIWSPTERSFVQARFVPEVPEDLPGAGMKPDPVQAKSVPEFIELMNKYRRWAGSPSFRVMADRVGVRSSSRFCEALRSDRLPTFALLNAFVVALEGTSADFQRWAAAWRALEGELPIGPPALPLPLPAGEDTK
ncbi:hypothetical protein [Nocardiopsis sp. SBT366]|uniref:hypothetical protein n=1 Tax=Nocardiopsis sp. SBT366 TaxID=1580529 RepID=UPI00066C847A|nr:hypothetical protein [Nocardiopsis sp. SBT366]